MVNQIHWFILIDELIIKKQNIYSIHGESNIDSYYLMDW